MIRRIVTQTTPQSRLRRPALLLPWMLLAALTIPVSAQTAEERFKKLQQESRTEQSEPKGVYVELEQNPPAERPWEKLRPSYLEAVRSARRKCVLEARSWTAGLDCLSQVAGTTQNYYQGLYGFVDGVLTKYDRALVATEQVLKDLRENRPEEALSRHHKDRYASIRDELSRLSEDLSAIPSSVDEEEFRKELEHQRRLAELEKEKLEGNLLRADLTGVERLKAIRMEEEVRRILEYYVSVVRGQKEAVEHQERYDQTMLQSHRALLHLRFINADKPVEVVVDRPDPEGLDRRLYASCRAEGGSVEECVKAARSGK